MLKNFFLILSLIFALSYTQAQTIRVGAKHFNESYILGEIISQLLESEGYKVERKFNLGGTLVCFEALRNKEIDVYPEYTGTISEAILKMNDKLSFDELKKKLNDEINLNVSERYGFNNAYAFALKKNLARELNINTISD